MAHEDWEATLRTWVKKSSDDEEARRDKNEAEVRQALLSSKRLPTSQLNIYVKGSYANNTNVRLDYDVDIGVEYTGLIYRDTTGAADDVKKAALATKSAYTGPYGGRAGAAKFKDHVELALVDAFGSTAVSRGKLSLRCGQTPASGSTWSLRTRRSERSPP